MKNTPQLILHCLEAHGELSYLDLLVHLDHDIDQLDILDALAQLQLEGKIIQADYGLPLRGSHADMVIKIFMLTPDGYEKRINQFTEEQAIRAFQSLASLTTKPALSASPATP